MSNLPKTRAAVAARAAAAVAEDVADEDEKDDAIAPSKEGTVIAGGKPVLSHPRIHGLFPRRDGKQLRVLVDAIAKHGQSHPVLLVDRGDCFIIIDGHDTVRVVAYLQSQGNPIHLSYEVYTPQAADPDGAAIECMAVAIRRKLLATSVELTKERKQDAILAYLAVCSQRDVYQSARWVSRILGCTPSWVIEVRRRAIRSGSLPYRDHYQSEDGNWKVAENTYKDRDALGVLEANPDVEEADDIVRLTQATPPATPRIDETKALESIQAGGMRDTKEDAPSKEFGDLEASEEDIKKTGDHMKSEEQLLTEWNSKHERPIEEWVFNGMQYHNVQKVWWDKCNGKWKFDTKVMALDHGQAVKVVGHQNDCTICRIDMVIDGNTVPLHFRVADPSFPKLFDEVEVPKRLEGVSSAPPSILPDEVKTALGVLVAASRSLSCEQQKELRAWLVQFLELWET